MHNLTQLKNLFHKAGISIIQFNGMYLTTSHGRFSMAGDEYFLDGNPINRKELKLLIKGE
jgi:hypothetical protein